MVNLQLNSEGVETPAPLKLPAMPVTFSHLLVYGALATPLQQCIVHPKSMDELGYLSMGPDFTSLM